MRLDTRVVEVTPEAVHLGDGEMLPAHTLVWAAGIKTVPLADALDLDQGPGGRLVVEPDLSVPGHPNVFVIGDLASSKDDTGALHPQVAPLAIQGAEHVAQQIQRHRAGQPTEAFTYVDKGIMATIGRHAAVAEVEKPFRARTTGFFAWLMWLALHLVMLIGFRNRLQVMMNWTWNYFTYDRSARLILGRPVRSRGEPLQHDHEVTYYQEPA